MNQHFTDAGRAHKVAPTLRRAAIPLLVLALLAAGPHLGAQTAPDEVWDPSGLTMDREGLEALSERLARTASSSAYSSRTRERARRDARAIRERLERGDFRTGDRIVLSVEGEPQLPDTVLVEPGPRITLPLFGSIPLDGVLRSELEAHLARELGASIQDPVVEARALIRLSILGAVGRPGFYNVPADIPLGDALMRAGGPGQSSDLERLRIERRRGGREVFLQGNELQEYVAEGRTLDQLNLRAGDQIVLPAARRNPWWRTGLRYGLVIASSLLLGVRIF